MSVPSRTPARAARRGRGPVSRVAGASAVAAVLVAGWAAPASAEVPEGWDVPPEVDTLDALLLLGALPLGLFLLITLAVLVPSLARGEPLGRPEEAQWLGGPGKDPKELAAPGASAGAGAAGASPATTGGASGRW